MFFTPRNFVSRGPRSGTNEKIQLLRVGFFGSGTRIRTQTYRVRVCCATFTQYRYISVPEYCTTLGQGLSIVIFVKNYIFLGVFFLIRNGYHTYLPKNLFLGIYIFITRLVSIARCIRPSTSSLLSSSSICWMVGRVRGCLGVNTVQQSS